MSNRFYVNDVQIFGNNEMFKNTYTELEKQGAEWTEDGTFDAIEIKDPQGLMNAVENAWRYLKRWVEEKRIFTSLNLYYAIQSEVKFNDCGKLELKKDGKIIACMY